MKKRIITSVFWTITTGLFAVLALGLWLLIDIKLGSAEILFDWHFNSKRQIVIDICLYGIGIFLFYLSANALLSISYTLNKNVGRLTLIAFFCALLLYLASNLVFAAILAIGFLVNFLIIRKLSL